MDWPLVLKRWFAKSGKSGAVAVFSSQSSGHLDVVV